MMFVAALSPAWGLKKSIFLEARSALKTWSTEKSKPSSAITQRKASCAMSSDPMPVQKLPTCGRTSEVDVEARCQAEACPPACPVSRSHRSPPGWQSPSASRQVLAS